MTALIVIFAIIAFFAVLLSLSASFHIYYDGDFTVKLFYGPFRYKLYPAKQKPKKKKAKTTQQTEQKKPQEKEKKGFFETVSEVFDIIKAALGPAAWLLKKIRISALDATVVVATGDAAKTAKQYGEVSAAVYGCVVGLKNYFPIHVKNLSVGYNFKQQENTYDVFFKVKIRLSHLVCAAVKILWNIVFGVFKKSSDESNIRQNVQKAE